MGEEKDTGVRLKTYIVHVEKEDTQTNEGVPFFQGQSSVRLVNLKNKGISQTLDGNILPYAL
jgi:hypothetical protein